MCGREIAILAAGKGSGIRFQLPERLHTAGGRSMIHCVVHRVHEPGTSGEYAIVARCRRELMMERLRSAGRHTVQTEQRGTDHALTTAREHMRDVDSKGVVAHGDMPLIDPSDHLTLQAAPDRLNGDSGQGECCLTDVVESIGLAGAPVGEVLAG